jgi:hypothetical protein
MTTFRSLGRRAGTVLALASSALLITAGLAHADTIANDLLSGGPSGDRTLVVGTPITGNYWVHETGGHCDASDGTPVTVNIVTPAEVTATPASLTFTQCGDSDTNTQSVSFSSTTLKGAPGYSITHTTSDADTNDSYTVNGANFKLLVVAPSAANQAPQVATEADNADGLEGTPGEPSTHGAFSDPDGDSLTITKASGDGTVTDNGDGTWSWSHVFYDDSLIPQSVTVQASDGSLTATDTFTWTTANVIPVVGTITATPSGPCSVGISAPFSDQGTLDTHTASISWGDTSATNVGAVAQPGPVTGSHTYTANGTYTIGVTVTDDDSGVGSNSLTDAFATKNVASNFLEPINAAGTRSVFKLGSTIPLKIRVTGCDGFSVTGLAPVISSIKVDSTAGDSINENTVSTATPTTGTTMRWADTQYIYNFSTKNSTMSNLPSTLTAGTYTVTASDQSFYAPVTATFDLKK